MNCRKSCDWRIWRLRCSLLLKMLDLSKFHYIKLIAQERSLTKAAKKLFISQPSLSTYVNQLEEELGVKLFDRTKKPIQITYAGEYYISEGNRLLQAMLRLENDLQEISAMKKCRLTIGIGAVRASHWLPYILPAFQQKHPQVDIRIVEGTESIFEDMLINGQIDLALMSLPIISPNIDYEMIQPEKIVLSVPQKHPILNGLDCSNNSCDNLLYINPELLNGQKIICPSPGYGLYNFTTQLLRQHNIRPGEIITVNNSDTAFLLSAAGMGLVFTAQQTHMSPKPLQKPIYCTIDRMPMIRHIIAAYHSGVGLSLAGKYFICETKRILKTEPSIQPL